MTKTHTDYADEIRKLHGIPCRHEGQEKRLHACIKEWSSRVPLEFMRPNNEQKPYTEAELGYPVIEMPRKAESGIKQVGDYIAAYLITTSPRACYGSARGDHTTMTEYVSGATCTAPC